MALWRLGIVGGGFLADGTEVKIVTGVDDHSWFCVIASATLGATGRAVCLAFAAALRRFGVPDEVLTDNGKQFTARFGHGGEVLFDRICRDNGIMHRLTAPASPTTTGKVERFHQTLRRELVADHGPFATIAELQAAQGLLGGGRLPRPPPHQSLGMASPVDRFEPAPAGERELLALRLPATLSAAPAPPAELEAPDEPAPPPVSWSSPSAIEFDRVVPPSRKPVGGGQAGLAGPSQGGVTVRFWADHDVLHLLVAGPGSSRCAPISPAPTSTLSWPPAPNPPGRRRCRPPSRARRSRSTGS